MHCTISGKVAHTPNIELRLHARLHAVYGVEKVESLEILDEKTGAIETIEDPGCGIFVYAGTVPNTELYNEIRLDNGFIWHWWPAPMVWIIT